MINHLNPQTKGALIAFSGAFILSPDSLLIRMVELDQWTIVFLRSLFMSISLMLLYVVVFRKSFIKAVSKFDKPAFSISLLMCISTFFFISSILTTSVAHTLIIVATVPVFSSILGYLFLGERVDKVTMTTILVVTLSMFWVVQGKEGNSSILGDLLALGCTLMLALVFLFARKTRVTNRVPVMSMSGLLAAIIALPLASFNQVDVTALGYCLLLGFINGVAFSLLTLAPRYIISAKVALYMPIETVFGTLLVWWLLGEYPGMVSLAGGFIVLSAIMFHSYYQIRYSKP